MARICILDDELKAAEVLQHLIVEVEGVDTHEILVLTDPEQAITEVVDFAPDLLFLDIKMPAIDGFGFLNAISPHVFDVIFVTAYEQYAIQAIRRSALDYILKPVEEKDLRSAFERFHSNHRSGLRDKLSMLNANLNIRDSEKFKISLSSADRTHFVELASIVRCEAQGNYTSFHFTDGSRLLSSKTLKSYCDILESHSFMRVHKSHLINPIHIDALISTNALKMVDQSRVPVARRRKKEILDHLQTVRA